MVTSAPSSVLMPPQPAGALDAPAARRNAGPLLSVLETVLPSTGTVLEIGSGTGQHAAAFAAALSPRRWLPTDAVADRFASIRAWIDSLPEDGPHPLTPRLLNAASPPGQWPIEAEDDIRAVVSVNVIHIAPWKVGEGLFAGAAALLRAGDPLILYGPFGRHGAHTGPGNQQFDASLRAEDPSWGIRDLEGTVVPAAAAVGLSLDAIHPMPANNLTVVFRRR